MKIKNPRTEQYERYWDEGNKNDYEWYKKGEWKRLYRKRFIRQQLKQCDKE